MWLSPGLKFTAFTKENFFWSKFPCANPFIHKNNKTIELDLNKINYFTCCLYRTRFPEYGNIYVSYTTHILSTTCMTYLYVRHSQKQP